ncbi:hypothetical protein Aperf_G00000020458 [Anoplocephala perfoliata]
MQEHSGSAISPKHPVGKRPIRVRVLLLDGHLENFILSPRCPGQEFFDLVVQLLQLEDTDYFDLEYEDIMGNKCWLDHFKPIYKPVSQMFRKPAQFSFKVKFYTIHLDLLTDKLTRRLFALQVKRDLIDGELNCGENTAALLTAFILQAELGDREEEDRRILTYLENLRLSKQYSPAFLSKVVDLHSNLEGMSEGEAYYRLLDAARKLEFYGLKLHPARENGGIMLNLGVTHAGLFLYQNKTKLNHFSWSKIRKLSFKRTKFLIKLHSGTEPFGKDTVEFTFDTRDSCKNFWKKCLEHHAFFRSRETRGEAGAGSGGLGGFGAGIWTSSAPPAHPYASQPSLRFIEDKGSVSAGGSNGGGGFRLSRSASLKSGRNQGIFSKGSSYRYCGRTQQQLIECSYNSSGGTISPEKRSRSVGRLGSGQNLNRFGSPHLRRSIAHVDEKHAEELPSLLQNQQSLFRGSSSSTVAADFGFPATSLPDHYQLLFLSTPIRRPISTRHRTSSSHSTDQNSLPTESPCKVGAQLLESEHGASVPRVFSANLIKTFQRHRESGSLTNTSSPVVTSAVTRPSDVESFTKYSLSTGSRPSVTSGLTSGSVPFTLNDSNEAEKQSKASSSGEKHTDRSSEVQTPSDVFIKAFSSSDDHTSGPISSSGAQPSLTSISTGQLAQALSASENYPSQCSLSLPPEQYDEIAEDEDESDRPALSDDSLLQHPLSVCASRAVSSNDLYRSDSNEFQYPVCKLDDPSSPMEQESENGRKSTVYSIFSPYAQESPPEKTEAFGYSSHPSKSAPASRRASNYSTHGEDFDESGRMEEDPYSLAPAPSIGAISAITGVSCFDDDEDDNVPPEDEERMGDGEGADVSECLDEVKTEAPSLFSGPSSPAVDTPSSSLPAPSINQEGVRIEVESSQPATSQIRQRLRRRRRTRKREHKQKLEGLNYSTVAATAQQIKSSLTPYPASRLPRKSYRSESELTESLNAEITNLISPLYCQHTALLQAALARVASWEKAALNAAAARTHFQSALAGIHKAQRTRRKRAARQIQAGRRRRKPSRPMIKGDDYDDDHHGEAENELSDSSTSVSGVPRSSSRNELPPSIESSHNRPPPAEGCNLTASSTSCSSFSSSLEISDAELGSLRSSTAPPDLASAERELRETTRCLAEVARIADIYRLVLQDELATHYEAFVSALPDLLNKHLSSNVDKEDALVSGPSRLTLLRIPIRRIWYYHQVFKRLAELQGKEHLDREDANVLVSRLSNMVENFESIYRTLEAYTLVAEFCQDYQLDTSAHEPCRRRACSIAVLKSLVNEPSSGLVRVGFLEKMSSRGRGFQPRMALLLTDRLIYCGRVSGSSNMQLKIHGVVSLHNAGLESPIKASVSFSEGIGQEGITASQKTGRQRHSFAILVFSGERREKTQSSGLTSAIKSVHGRNHRVVFAAPSEEQKRLWLSALDKVIGRERDSVEKSHSCLITMSPSFPRDFSKRERLGGEDRSNPSSGTQETHSDVISNNGDNHLGLLGPRSHLQQTVLRCSGLAYVCWHRRLSVSLDNILNANQYEISGYLLRKFKSSCGWQKLWSVFTDFTLFFYKSPEDFIPIASLPLLGYHLESTRPSSAAVTSASATAGADTDAQLLHKSNVLQLTYKSHGQFWPSVYVQLATQAVLETVVFSLHFN